MERKFLEDLGLAKEVIDKVLDANSADIGKHKSVAEAAQTKLADLTAQLSQRDTDIAELKKADAAGLQSKLNEMQGKYEAESKEWAEKEKQRAHKDRRDTFFAGTQFADDYAKRGIMAEFDERGFQYSETDKSFVGAGEWLERLKAAAPTSFKSDVKPPIVVRPTDAKAPAEVTKETFAKMGYLERIALKQNNPELYQTLKE